VEPSSQDYTLLLLPTEYLSRTIGFYLVMAWMASVSNTIVTVLATPAQLLVLVPTNPTASVIRVWLPTLAAEISLIHSHQMLAAAVAVGYDLAEHAASRLLLLALRVLVCSRLRLWKPRLVSVYHAFAPRRSNDPTSTPCVRAAEVVTADPFT
jgi:hypothetical protein